MPTTNTTDWLALKAHVDTLITDPVMQVYDPGAIVSPPDPEPTQWHGGQGWQGVEGWSTDTAPPPYILLSDVPNDPVRFGLSARPIAGVDHARSGTLLLTIMWPIAWEIEHAMLLEIVGQVAAHFPADQCMRYGQSRLRVTRDADALQPYVDGVYRVAVVRVPWSSK